MSRLLSVLVLLVAAVGCAARRPATASSERARAEMRGLEREYLEALFRRRPEDATAFGVPAADHAAVTDDRPEALSAWHATEDGFLLRTRALDPEALAGTPEGIARGILLEALEGARAARVCRYELWPVSSVGGWQGEYAELAEVQPVGTRELRAAARRRLSAMARRIGVQLDNLREGIRLGYVATRENVERVVAELDRLLATPPASWPYLRPAVRDGDEVFRVELAEVLERELVPAADRYRTFLVNEYLGRVRRGPSLLGVPDGERCYLAAVRQHATVELDAPAIHALGLARVQELHAEMRRIAERSFATSNVPDLLRRLREDPAFRFSDRSDIVAVSRAAVGRAVEAAPRFFGRVTRAPVAIREYAEFLRGSDPAERYTPDFSGGSLAGIYFINAFDPARKERAHLESTAFHETIPGHHLQIGVALERNAGGPEIGKYVLNSGFVEGWAVYAERLAGEMGLFSSDVYRLGGLANEAFRAARLVVDSGLNVFGWSRERAIDYLVANGGLSPEWAASEVDRYLAWPGQATAYMLGALEILRLRAGAERALGPRFDLRAFHDAVLEDGAVTLPMLRERVARWVEERRAGK